MFKHLYKTSINIYQFILNRTLMNFYYVSQQRRPEASPSSRVPSRLSAAKSSRCLTVLCTWWPLYPETRRCPACTRTHRTVLASWAVTDQSKWLENRTADERYEFDSRLQHFLKSSMVGWNGVNFVDYELGVVTINLIILTI